MRGVELGQQPVLFEILELRAVLGEIHIGGRRAALLQKLVGEDDAVVGAHFDFDVSLLFERRHEFGAHLRVLAVVEEDRAAVRRASASGYSQEERQNNKGAQRMSTMIHGVHLALGWGGKTTTGPTTPSSTSSPTLGISWSNVLALRIVRGLSNSDSESTVSGP